MLPMIICAIESPEDRDLMTAFYLQYRDYLYHQALKYQSNAQDAEDIVHDALACIIRNLEVFRGLHSQQQLVYAKVTVRNLVYAQQKRSAHFDVVSVDAFSLDIPVDENSLPENVTADRQRREKIQSIWNETDAEDRLLLEQKYILKWSDAELAERLGIQTQSVRMRLTRAKRNLARQMEEKGFLATQW